jgi:bifunctional UDP-N-acetylglucosamine pyrophosphorylase/glucosamine-1-phosphate N-acetyltransferase
MVCQPALEQHQGSVLILSGDTPLLRAESLEGLLSALAMNNAACVVGTATTSANAGLGRIVRDANGGFQRIVEHKDATAEQLEIQEINTGCYAFHTPRLLETLQRIQPDNSQAEYYLTDCPALLAADGHPVLAADKLDIREAMGVNTRRQLADVERVLQATWQQQLMDSGVSIVAPELTYIDLRAQIGPETVIHPFTTVLGSANIGAHCQLGPHSHVGPGANLPAETTIGAFEKIP